MADFDAAGQEFLAWLQRSGAEISPKIKLEDLRQAHAGRGIIAIQNIAQDEVLFRIPRSAILSVENSILSTEIPAATLEMLGPWLSLILVMLYEYLNGDASNWSSYFSVLPTEFNTLMFWSDDELAELQASAVVDKIGRDGANELFLDLLVPVIKEFAHVFFAGDERAKQRAEEMRDERNLTLMHMMGSLIMAYAFDIEPVSPRKDVDDEGFAEEEEDEALPKGMVPLADMLNADADRSNARLLYEGSHLDMKALKPIRAGEEVYNDYGPLPRSDLLRRYGYITDNYAQYDVVEIPMDLVTDCVTAAGIHFQARLDYLEDQDMVDSGYDITTSSPFTLQESLSPELIILMETLLLPDVEFDRLKGKGKLPKPEKITSRGAEQLQKIVQARIAQYGSTLEQDLSVFGVSQVNSVTLKDRRYAMARAVRIGEKRILRQTEEALADLLARDGAVSKRQREVDEEGDVEMDGTAAKKRDSTQHGLRNADDQLTVAMAALDANSSAASNTPTYRIVNSQPENPFTKLITGQKFAIIPQVTLESGAVLHNVSVAYKTYGTLAPGGDNAMVICHALTGSADVGDWWGPLLGGPGKAFDTSRFFVVCMNSLGSPYGSASPVTAKDGDASLGLYGPDFPLTSVRDDVNIFKLVLDDLGVKQIAAVIGGSMGGMLVLEFAYFGKDYVRCIIPIATSARYSAWGISWGEAQRQSIYSDPKYDDGYYAFEDPPSTGLGAARMSALLTYRSRDSFESRFGRNTPDISKKQSINSVPRPSTPSNPSHEHWAIHNDGHKHAGSPRPSRTSSSVALTTVGTLATAAQADLEFHDASNPPTPPIQGRNGASSVGQTLASAKRLAPHYFSAQSYLRYQGEKFIKRFDANCYIAITRKLDTHDVSRDRFPEGTDSETLDPVLALHYALSLIEQPTLVLGIQSDGLFTFAEQQELAAHIPNAALKTIDSPDGHDAFLLEFEQVNGHLTGFLKTVLPDIMNRSPTDTDTPDSDMATTKTSTFGEAEVEDITAW